MMPPLWLDYERPAPGRHRAGVLLLLAGMLATGALLALYVSVIAARDELQAQVVRLERQAAQRRLFEPGAVATAAGVGRETSALPPSAARWESLFAALEKAGDETVTLLDLEPGASEIHLGGEAKDLAATLDYVKRLQGASAFSDAHLTKYETVVEHPYRPVRFTLVAAWREVQR